MMSKNSNKCIFNMTIKKNGNKKKNILFAMTNFQQVTKR